MSRPNHGPRLRPNKAGIYYVCWSENGRSYRASTRTGNLPEAQKILAGYLLEKEKDQDCRVTVKGVIAYYDLNHISEVVVDKQRQRKALKYIAAILNEDRYLDELADDDFVKYRQKRRAVRGPKGLPTNDATIRRELNTFVAAINFAVKNKKLDPRHTPVIALPDHNPGKERYLERDEAQALLAAAQGDAHRLTPTYRLVAIALATAKRRRAIETLKWFAVDLKNRVIDFRRPGEAETKKRRGRAPISDWLLPILERAYREKTSEYVLDLPATLTKQFNKAVRKAKLASVTPHTLRHTWGTWAAQGGMSMWEIAGVMGCTIQTATNNYLHHSPDHLREVANRVSPDGAVSAQNDARNQGS